jgi:hypothetical protein
MAQTVVQRTEDILFSEVLFGIPLAELGFTEPDFFTLRDVLGEAGNRYSLWRDPANAQLHKMHHSLIHAFTLHDKLNGHFWVTTLPDGSPEWRNDV